MIGILPYINVLKSESGTEGFALKIFRSKTVVIRKCLEKKESEQVPGIDELENMIIIPVDDMFHRNAVCPEALVHVSEEVRITSCFDGLELVLHFHKIGRKQQLGIIRIFQAVNRVHAHQPEFFLHAFSKVGVGPLIDLRHHHQRCAYVETMAIFGKAGTSPAREIVLFKDGDMEPAPGKVGCCSKPCHPRTDDCYFFHIAKDRKKAEKSHLYDNIFLCR